VLIPARPNPPSFIQVLALCIVKGLITACCCLKALNWGDILDNARAHASGTGGRGRGVSELTPLSR
jgi:hypothetical protein